MAEPQVTGLRSAEFRVPDLAAAKKFYEDSWGLETAAKEGNAVYLRGTGSEHHCLVLREGGDTHAVLRPYRAGGNAAPASRHNGRLLNKMPLVQIDVAVKPHGVVEADKKHLW